MFILVLAELRSLTIVCLRLWLGPPSHPESAPPTMWPSVTVHVPAYREHLVIARTLSSLLELDYPRDRFSILVIDDSEDDEAELTRAAVSQLKKAPSPSSPSAASRGPDSSPAT